jgi:hypothetical protein
MPMLRSAPTLLQLGLASTSQTRHTEPSAAFKIELRRTLVVLQLADAGWR